MKKLSLTVSLACFGLTLGLSFSSAQVDNTPQKASKHTTQQVHAKQTLRRPPAVAEVKTDVKTAAAPHKPYASGGSYILDGLPILLTLHHDTKASNNEPIDVYDFVIELQIMNSDGNLEPEGLQFHNFYTAKPLDASHDVNPNNARDCKKWNDLQVLAGQNRDPKLKTWPYVEFVTAVGARTVQTNEDGQVYWSDDIECWGASDRFPPF